MHPRTKEVENYKSKNTPKWSQLNQEFDRGQR